VGITTGVSNGRPTATTSSCSVDIGTLDISLSGGASWLYNLFIGLFSGQIKSSTQSSLQSAIPNSIDTGLANVLATLPIAEPINHEIEINYELQRAPSIYPDYFTLDTLGEFYAVENPSEAPFSPGSLPDVATNEMVQIFLSDFVLNSAAYVFFTEHLIEFTVTDSMLPKDAPVQLNTTYFSIMIPNLYKMYPNKMFNLFLYTRDTPVGNFTTSGAEVNAPGAIDIVILPDNIVAFTLGVQVLTAGTAGLNGQNITGELSFLNTSLSLLNSTIGDFDVSVLQTIVDDLVKVALIPMVNKILATGFPLPSVSGLTFISPRVGWGDGYLYVSTNVNYLPPSVAAKQKAQQEQEVQKIVIV